MLIFMQLNKNPQSRTGLRGSSRFRGWVVTYPELCPHDSAAGEGPPPVVGRALSSSKHTLTQVRHSVKELTTCFSTPLGFGVFQTASSTSSSMRVSSLKIPPIWAIHNSSFSINPPKQRPAPTTETGLCVVYLAQMARMINPFSARSTANSKAAFTGTPFATISWAALAML